MTLQERYAGQLKATAKKAGKPLGRQAEASLRRPANYGELCVQDQWDIDKMLGILDWNGEWNT